MAFPEADFRATLHVFACANITTRMGLSLQPPLLRIFLRKILKFFLQVKKLGAVGTLCSTARERFLFGIVLVPRHNDAEKRRAILSNRQRIRACQSGHPVAREMSQHRRCILPSKCAIVFEKQRKRKLCGRHITTGPRRLPRLCGF